MKFGRPISDEGEQVPMAPLIDIVFLILVFFMTTSVYSTLETEIDIELPTAQSSVQSERLQGEIFVNLKKDGSILLNDRVVDLEKLQRVLMSVSEHFPGGTVIIRGDKEADLGMALAILDCCKLADIQNVSFATLPVGEQEGS